MAILIQNALVVTQNNHRDIIDHCDILVEGNQITAIGRNLKTKNSKHETSKPETILDATGKIVLPGLVNAHTHSAMTLLRGLGEDLPLHRWLEEKIWPAEARLTRKQVYYSTLLGICEMLRSGVTAFMDMYLLGLDEMAKACEEAGIRASLSDTIIEMPGHNERRAGAFVKKWKGSTYVRPHVSCHSLYACSEEMLVKGKALARKHNVPFQIHVSETRKELFDCLDKTKKYPLEYLETLNLLDSETVLAHASWVTKREIALAGKRKATIVNCPVSNLKLATGGICPVREYPAAGANVAIGTDGPASNNSLNMFESMKMSALLQKHHYWKADALPAQAFLDFATRNGAKAMGINAGSIEAGKLADIILLDAKMPNLQPMHDVVSNLVYSAGPQNVTDVIVNGKIVMRERKILTMDENGIVERVNVAKPIEEFVGAFKGIKKNYGKDHENDWREYPDR